jgi:PhnB protein
MTSLPPGHHSVCPFLIVNGARGVAEFLSAAFGATERERITRADGSIGHAEVQIGDSVVMLTDATDELAPRPSAFYLYVGDVDEAIARAVRSGATVRSEPADKFYGNREAALLDQWSNIWWVATSVEDVPPAELQARYDKQI